MGRFRQIFSAFGTRCWRLRCP